MESKKNLLVLRIIIVVLAVIGIAIYWWARKIANLSIVAVIQPTVTILCILNALLSLKGKYPQRKLTIWIVVGLSIALIADFLSLDMGNPFVVIRGLIFFVFVYLTYSIGLTILNGFHRQDILVGSIALIVYVSLMTYLTPFLGSMQIPAYIYGLILPFLVTRAISTFFGSKFSKTQAILLTIGASFVYLGDIEFALHAYAKLMPNLFGPILYAGGQLLISSSPSFGKNPSEENAIRTEK